MSASPTNVTGPVDVILPLNNTNVAIGDASGTRQVLFSTATATASTNTSLVFAQTSNVVLTFPTSTSTMISTTTNTAGSVLDAALSTNVVLLNAAQTISARKTFTSSPVIPSILDSNGNTTLSFSGSAIPAAYLIVGTPSGNSPVPLTVGLGANNGISLAGNGTGTMAYSSGASATSGAHAFTAGTAPILTLNSVASGVNSLTITSGATGSGVQLAATGGDTNVGFTLVSAGTGTLTHSASPSTAGTANAHLFKIGTLNTLTLSGTASAVNYVNVTNAATGSGPTIASVGGDTNVGLTLISAGTGALTHSASPSTAGTANAHLFKIGTLNALTLSGTASAVNYVNVTNAATGSGPTIASAGGDTNIALTVASVGTGAFIHSASPGTANTANAHVFQVGTLNALTISGAVGAVNYVNIISAPTLSAPTISAAGTGTNVNLTFSARSTGNLVMNNNVQLVAGTNATNGQPLTFQSGTLITAASAVAGACEYDGSAFYATPNTANRGVTLAEHVVVTTSNGTSTNSTSTLSWLTGALTNGTLTLNNTTQSYEFEGMLILASVGATSRVLSVGFNVAGTVTVSYTCTSAQNTTSFATLTTPNMLYISTTTTTSVAPTISASGFNIVNMQGTIRVTTGTTPSITPVYKWSAAPGTSSIPQAGSFFRIRPLGNGASVGNWS